MFNSRLVAVTGGEVRAMGLLMFRRGIVEGLDGVGGLVGSMGTWLWYRVQSGGLFLRRGRELARWYWYKYGSLLAGPVDLHDIDATVVMKS